VTARHRYLAGSDERRAEELLTALLDPEVRAVFLGRGGYGTQRLLSRLGPVATADPKPVVGFSDNTALLNHLRQAFGWAVVHGPHPQGDRPEALDAVLACLGAAGEPVAPAFEGLRLLGPARRGALEAELAGGCLSLVASSVGTPYAVEGRGRILFLEDTGEPAYRVDRMLHQLWASGSLEGVEAVVFGTVRSFVPEGQEREARHLEELLGDFAAAVSIPVLEGLPCGHTEPNLPRPLGPLARLDPARGELSFLEPAVGPR
jgi:muramoyltetrapeptide carboxypeptidase